MAFETASLPLLKEALEILEEGFRDLPDFDARFDMAALRPVILETARRLRDNYPYQHPLYIGHMIKPPHPVARLAYALALWINPNNHSFDGGRASSAMEKEAVAQLAHMIGWEKHLGHLCGGGTLANLEALWISGKLAPGKTIVASQQAHFTHERICEALRIPFESAPTDDRARMDMKALRETLDRKDVGMVVVTLGTTGVGAVDPLLEILELREEYGFRIHADAAYGGYYVLVDELEPDTRAVFSHVGEVDSLVVDQNTYFTSSELHLGEISLECSRAGAAAVALWATQRMLPLVKGGEFAQSLLRCRKAALRLYELIEAHPRFMSPFPPETDIVVWAPRADTVSEASDLSRALFEEASREGLHMALADVPGSFFSRKYPSLIQDRESITALRCCMMKPEHMDWIDSVWAVAKRAAGRVFERM